MPKYINVDKVPKDEFFEELSDIEKAKVIQWFVQAPSADVVEVKLGTWKCYSSTMMECSVCQRHVPYHRYEFCPHCGAEMSKED